MTKIIFSFQKSPDPFVTKIQKNNSRKTEPTVHAGRW